MLLDITQYSIPSEQKKVPLLELYLSCLWFYVKLEWKAVYYPCDEQTIRMLNWTEYDYVQDQCSL